MRQKLPEYDNNEIKRRIGGEIHKKRDRQILLLHLINEDSLMEISKKLDIPYGTVKEVWKKHREKLFPPV